MVADSPALDAELRGWWRSTHEKAAELHVACQLAAEDHHSLKAFLLTTRSQLAELRSQLQDARAMCRRARIEARLHARWQRRHYRGLYGE